MQNARHQGFTLLELLMSIAIIGILASIVLVAVTDARQKARNTAVISQMDEYQKSLELFYSQNGYYPGTNGSRTARFCMGDNPVGNCMGTLTSGYDNNDSLINEALRVHMATLPRFDQSVGSLNYSSPAYSGCTGAGTANTSCTVQDYSFWFLLEGVDQECGKAIVANGNLSGEYTVCRLQAR